MSKIEEFRNYLRIDKTRLDDELVEQPQLFFEVSEQYTEAVAHRDAMKAQVESVYASLDGSYRSGEKSTEGAIKSQIINSEHWRAANDDFLQAKKWADQWGVLKDSFNQRSEMLKSLCKLYATNYFETRAIMGNADTNEMAYEARKQKMSAKRRTV